MSEDIRFDDDDQGHDAPSVPHDDIMKRLLDYQRQLREGEEEDAFLAGDLEGIGPAPREDWSASSADDWSPSHRPERVAAPMTLTGHLVDITTDTDAVSHRETETVSANDGSSASAKAWAPTPTQEAEASTTDARSPALAREADLAEPTPWAPDSVPDHEDERDRAFGYGRTPSIDPFDSRVAGLERLLDRLQHQVGELRQSFSDLAVACDRRLAAIEDAIAEARLGHTP